MYLQPETLLLQSPEIQTNFRKFLVKKIKEPPHVDPVQYIGEEI